MHIQGVDITFPVRFLESLMSDLPATTENSRKFTSTISEGSKSKQSYCEIVATISYESIQLYIKSDSFQCRDECLSCSIDNLSEITAVRSTNRIKTPSKQSQRRKQNSNNKKSNETNRENVQYGTSCPKPCNPKRKIKDCPKSTSRTGKKRKLSQEASENFSSRFDESRNKLQSFIESKILAAPASSVLNGVHGVTSVDETNTKIIHDIILTVGNDKPCEKSVDVISVDDVNTNMTNSDMSDTHYFSVNEIFHHVDTEKLISDVNNIPRNLKVVSPSNVDFKVSLPHWCIVQNPHESRSLQSVYSAIENVYSQNTDYDNHLIPNIKASDQVKLQESILLVEKATVPLFYIQGCSSLVKDSVLLGPFVLEALPVPILRLKSAVQYGYRLPRNWSCTDNSNGPDETGNNTSKSRVRLRKSNMSSKSLRGYSTKSETTVRRKTGRPNRTKGRKTAHTCLLDDDDDDDDVDDGDYELSQIATPVSELSAEANVENSSEDTKMESTVVIDEDNVGLLNINKTRKTKSDRKTLKKTKKIKKGKKHNCGSNGDPREATLQNQPETDSTKLASCEETTRENESPVNIPDIVRTITKRIRKKKKKESTISKRGNLEAMYKRWSNYCIRIVPEGGSDLWAPVNDLTLVVSKCKFCENSEKTFPDPLLLADHIRNIHKTESQYMEEVRECRARMKLKCNLCVEDKFYGRWESFGIHMRNVHSEKCDDDFVLHKCTVCTRTWINKSTCDRHMATAHGNSEKFLCHLCPQTFQWESSLRCHIKGIHEKETAHVCELCGTVFSRKEYVRVHMQKYHGEKSTGKVQRSRGIHCSICDLRLDKKKDITNHMAEVHQIVENHIKCKICKSKFNTKASLQTHSSEIHGSKGNKDYQHCPYCGSGFQARDNMLRHIAKDHLKIAPPKCPLCETQFDYNTDLRFHLKKEHGFENNDDTNGQADSLKSIANLKCEYCDKPFFWVMGFINHILVCHSDQFPFECTQCGQKFKEGLSLQHHIAFRHVKASKCKELITQCSSVDAKQQNSEASENSNITKDKAEVQMSKCSVNEEGSRETQSNSKVTDMESDTTVQPNQIETVLKTPEVFPSPHESIQIPALDIHGTSTGHQGNMKISVPATVDRWNHPDAPWSISSLQHHHSQPSREGINPVTRPNNSAYHVQNYERNRSDCCVSSTVHLTHSSTLIRPGHVQLHHPEQTPILPEHAVGSRVDTLRLSHHLSATGHGVQATALHSCDRELAQTTSVNSGNRCFVHGSTIHSGNHGLSHGSTSYPGDQCLVHGSTAHSIDRGFAHGSQILPSERGMIHMPAVNPSTEGTQLLTAENLIGLLHEFNSQHQTNQYFNPQFF